MLAAAEAEADAWRPNEGPQTEFLASSAYEVLYGGAAGGGKSEAMVMDALRYVDRGDYQSICFRRTFPELQKSLIERSLRYYNLAFAEARYNDSKHVWRFPSGALGYFGHLEHDTSVYEHQSAEYQYIGFEELTSFTEFQYRYMLSRARGSPDIPIRIRANCNPGGEGQVWVQRRWAPWLGPPPEDGDTYRGPKAEPGEVLWYITKDDGTDLWLDKQDAKEMVRAWKAAPREKQLELPLPLSRTFIPAKLKDNPKIDPAYAARLSALDPVTRAQLKDGNWLIRPGAGMFFKRGWFKFVDAVPEGARRVRYWDLAGTEAEEGRDPDWTVGLLLAIQGNAIYVVDVVRFRGTPKEVEATILATAKLDGQAVEIGLPQDPGQAGKFQASYLISKLMGHVVHAEPETGDKVTRAKPISSQVEAGNVHLVRAPWNTAFVQELESFPTKKIHDDQVDALSGAFARVAGPPPSYGGLPVVVGRWGSGR